MSEVEHDGEEVDVEPKCLEQKEISFVEHYRVQNINYISREITEEAQ